MSAKNTILSQKKLIIILAVALAAVIIFGVALAVVPQLLDDGKDNNNFDDIDDIKPNYNFYPADYNENIFEDDEYLKLVEEYGILTYYTGYTRVELNNDNADAYGEQVELIVNMIYAAVNGNAKEYNSYFSKKYFKRNEPKEKFTMQKIFNGEISEFGVAKVSENGNNYTEYTYRLTFEISENNGTFRDDFFDQRPRHHVTISNRDGEFKIDAIDRVRVK